MKTETGTNASSLSRFNSAPAALFDDLIIENGYLVNKTSGPETYGSNNKSINDEMNTDGSFIGSFPAGSLDEDSSVFSDQFPKPESGVGELDPSENENQVRGEGEKRPWEMLAHHLSLPKTSLEKLMQLQQDSVPCQTRAKRGCATHPRSIVERVRRTKISERMRKLHDLVPNMDKVINSNYSRLQKAQVARIDFPKFDGERVRLLEKRGEIMDDPMAELRNLQETEGIDPSLRRETLSEVGKLGLHLLEDLTAIAAGGSATWLHVSSIQRSFALDILEFVLSNYVPVFRALIPYEQVLRHQICSLLMTSIRTNVELEGEVGEPSFRRLVLRSVAHIIKLYSSSLITKCEVLLNAKCTY